MMFGYFHYYAQSSALRGDPRRARREIEQSLPDHNPSAYIPLVLAGVFLGSPELFHVVESSGGACGWEIFGERRLPGRRAPRKRIAHYLLDRAVGRTVSERPPARRPLRKVHLEELPAADRRRESSQAR